jgi:xanthine dehydrogenase YagS FAD-binding subunit
MRETVERPEAVVDINALPYRSIELGPSRLRVGSLTRMSELAAHPDVRRQFPVIVEALELSASAQLRNMASIGGNLMQRPRCLYFRDVSANCNRRTPGAGCSAIGGRNRTHAIFGTSEQCVATHPSDLAVALTALDALVITRDSNGEHPIRISEFFREPGTTPDQEHNLRPGQLIVAVEVPVRPESQRSGYLKVRDRESYEFALTSVAVALDIRAGSFAPPGWRPAVSAPCRGGCPRLRGRSSDVRPTPSCSEARRCAPPTARNRCRKMDSRWS